MIILLLAPAHGLSTRTIGRRYRGGAVTMKQQNARLDNIEQAAIAAAEAWDTYVTDFLPADLLTAAAARLDGLDVGVARAGGRPEAARARLVCTNPELLDVGGPGTTAAEHAVVLRVTADFGSADPLPNVLDNIGVNMDSVGDLLISADRRTAFVTVAPNVVKTVQRLLPKSLPGNPVEVEPIEPGDEAAIDGVLQDVELQRLDKRRS